jgi:hypothetical protein
VEKRHILKRGRKFFWGFWSHLIAQGRISLHGIARGRIKLHGIARGLHGIAQIPLFVFPLKHLATLHDEEIAPFVFWGSWLHEGASN